MGNVEIILNWEMTLWVISYQVVQSPSCTILDFAESLLDCFSQQDKKILKILTWFHDPF